MKNNLCYIDITLFYRTVILLYFGNPKHLYIKNNYCYIALYNT